jgi:lysyl-tRNA synthetase class 2
MWLATSPEYQMKRLLAEDHETIFQIGPCFRRGEAGSRHNPEFTMLEWYRRGASMEDVMRDTEQLVARVSGGAFVLDRPYDIRLPLPRITVRDAFERFAKLSEDRMLALDEESFFRTWIDRVEPGLESMHSACFLTHFPTPMASLARKDPNDPRYAERFELYVAGMELCNGFGELVDPNEQRLRFEHDQRERKARNLPVYPIDEKLIEALSHLPPSAGNALGIDRLAALAAGTRDISSVIAFTSSEL